MIAGEIVLERLRTDEPTVVHRFDSWVQTQPDRPFFFYGEDERLFTYREFDRLTNRVANSLAALGIGPGRPRGRAFHERPRLRAQHVRCLENGRAVLRPINYRFVGDLLAYVIDDLAPQVLIADRHLVPALNDCRRQTDRRPPPGDRPRTGQGRGGLRSSSRKRPASYGL